MFKQHTSRFEDTIFAINYLCTEQTDVPIAEVDRTINFIQSSYEFYSLVNNLNLYNFNTVQKLLLQSVTKKIQNAINALSLRRNTSFDSSIYINKYIHYLKNIIQNASQEYVHEHVLENISCYFYNSNILMTYNKATYFNEINDLEQSNYIYKFGIGIDFVQGCSSVANMLHDNVSTEICRNVIVETRKYDKKRRIHIVQSDYININDYFNNLPKCKVLIHADSYNSCLYVERQLQLA